MLELKKITKIYRTGEFKQKALDNVSVNFRNNEFVSILGPSGSGKTTMLNIIGGLDKYTSGNLIINEMSTKDFKDSGWDTFRNHRVGFVFQSYNLITHQTVLSNVELALTLSGVNKEERTKEIGILRAIGARQRDISRVFNAETFIIGLISGLLGITILLNVPINIIINNLSGIKNVSTLPPLGATMLVIISVVLTVIAGLIPSRYASKKDPVVTLRSE